MTILSTSLHYIRFIIAISASCGALALLTLAVYVLTLGLSLYTPLGVLWFQLDPFSLNFTQAIIQRYISISLWDNVIVVHLFQPSLYSIMAYFVILSIIAYSAFPKRKNT